MQNRIPSLNDETAIRILSAIAQPRLRDVNIRTELTSELASVLDERYGTAEKTPSEGELARDALALLCEDPAMQPVITALLEGPETEHFGPGRGKAIGVGVAVLIALQTHVRFERTVDGKWQLLVEKPTTSEEILKPIAQKLLSLPASPAEKR